MASRAIEDVNWLAHRWPIALETSGYGNWTLHTARVDRRMPARTPSFGAAPLILQIAASSASKESANERRADQNQCPRARFGHGGQRRNDHSHVIAVFWNKHAIPVECWRIVIGEKEERKWGVLPNYSIKPARARSV